jgi:hypothetical protein
VTRLTSDERRAIQLELDAARTEIAHLETEVVRLQAMLDSQSAGSDGDTVTMLRPLCTCGLPIEHRRPFSGEPLPCLDETARIALDEGRSRPPVPMSTRAAAAIADLVLVDRDLREGRHSVTGDES